MTTPAAPHHTALLPPARATDDPTSCPVSRVVTALRRHTPLPEELGAAVQPDGRVDRVRWGLAVLGAAMFAIRVSCRPRDVRRVVAGFVETILAPTCADPARARLVERSVALIDVLYLGLGEGALRRDNPTLRRDAEAVLADEALWGPVR